MTKNPGSIYFFVYAKAGIRALYQYVFSVDNSLLNAYPSFHRRQFADTFWRHIKSFFVIPTYLLFVELIYGPYLTFNLGFQLQVSDALFIATQFGFIQSLISGYVQIRFVITKGINSSYRRTKGMDITN